MKQSAGLMLFRRGGAELEVVLVHPSGNYNRHKPWSSPKGLPDEGETLIEAAVRETSEEAGITVSQELIGNLTPLGSIQYTRSRKQVHAFALEAPPDAAPESAS